MKRAYDTAQKLQAQLGTVDIAIQRRHVYPLMADEHGSSIGAQIDNLLCEASKAEGVVKSVTLNLFDDQLDAVADYYKGPDL
jgi:hypothetical protein